MKAKVKKEDDKPRKKKSKDKHKREKHEHKKDRKDKKERKDKKDKRERRDKKDKKDETDKHQDKKNETDKHKDKKVKKDKHKDKKEKKDKHKDKKDKKDKHKNKTKSKDKHNVNQINMDQNNKDGTDDAQTSMLQLQELELQVALFPNCLSQETKSIMRCIRQGLVARYCSPGGTALAVRGVKFLNDGKGMARSACQPQLSHFTVTCQALVFCPVVGQIVRDSIVKECTSTWVELGLMGGAVTAYISSSKMHAAGFSFQFSEWVHSSDSSRVIKQDSNNIESFVVEAVNNFDGFLVVEGREPVVKSIHGLEF